MASAAEFAAALKARGFVYDGGSNRWHGPFGVCVPGDSLDPVIRDDYERALARDQAIVNADVQISARRRSQNSK